MKAQSEWLTSSRSGTDLGNGGSVAHHGHLRTCQTVSGTDGVDALKCARDASSPQRSKHCGIIGSSVSHDARHQVLSNATGSRPCSTCNIPGGRLRVAMTVNDSLNDQASRRGIRRVVVINAGSVCQPFRKTLKSARIYATLLEHRSHRGFRKGRPSLEIASMAV